MWKYSQTNHLEHYGVSGMKWGIRKAVAPANVNPGKKRTFNSLSEAERVAIIEDDIHQLAVTKKAEYNKAKTEAQKMKVMKKWDKYDQETQEVFEDDFNSVEITKRMAKVAKTVMSHPISSLYGPMATAKESSDFWKALAEDYKTGKL